MGHIAHLRKQFKSIKTYDYIITLIKRRKKTLLTSWEFIGSSFEQTWFPFTQGCFVPSLVEIGPVDLEKIGNVYRQTDGQTDGRQAIRKAHLSFQLRSAKKHRTFEWLPVYINSVAVVNYSRSVFTLNNDHEHQAYIVGLNSLPQQCWKTNKRPMGHIAHLRK